jgi:hypothetical protein
MNYGDEMRVAETGHYRLVGRETTAFIHEGDKVTVLDWLRGEDDDEWAGQIIDVLVETDKYGFQVWVDPTDLIHVGK